VSAARAEVGRAAWTGAPLVGLIAFLTWFGIAQADDRYWITLGIQAMWVGVSVIGVNLLLGYTGLLSLGHFAFFIYGGFVGAIWAVEGLGVNPWLGFPIAFLVGMAMGAVLALTCCHLRGFYLTVVTLAFALIASSLALLFAELFNGLAGRAVTEPLDTDFVFLSADNPNRPFVGLYWVGVVLLLACLMVTWNLMRSRWGRAFKAIRDSELAADASGVPTYWYKVTSFALSAGMVSLGGVLAAQTNLQVTMADGTVIVAQSFELVVNAVIGGLGTLAGAIVGAFAFTLGLGVNIGSDSLSERLGEWETAFLAALVVVAMIAMPEGIVGRLDRLGARFRPRRRPTPGVAVAESLSRPAGGSRVGEAALMLQDATRSFGGVDAVHGVNLRVEAGTVHALIGPNGSGKTTLVNLVTGFYRADRGRVLLGSTDITGWRPHRCNRAGLARTFQSCQIWRRMTVLENVMVGAHTRTPGDLVRSALLPVWLRPWERQLRTRALGLLAFVGLAERAQEPAGGLPFADQRRLEIARALASNPDLLILDEPAAGMQPSEVHELIELVARVRAAGITVVLIEHHMEVVTELADRVTVLNEGEVIAEGTPAEVAGDPLVITAYLGERGREPERIPARAAAELGTADSGSGATGALLSLRDVGVEYGAAAALVGVNLEVHEGEIVSIVGANGAGKTTTLKTISGVSELLRSMHGEITFLGERIERQPAHRISRMGLAHVPEGRRVFPESTVEENLLLGAYNRRDAGVRADIDAVYDRFPRLRYRRDQPAGLLSGGEQQMLAIGRALASRPRFLLLDEPSLGLAPMIVDEVFEIIRGLADEHVTILMVEQMATRAIALADRAYILETGRVVADGPAAALADDPEVRAAYLGG
jgi:ABC-type branched-subunit amino acid transport system ATPase component/ABC-type branched-subunit amino acid transport system permease subunit